MALTKKILRDVKALLPDERHWTIGSPEWERGETVCYCLGGALAKVITGNARDMYEEELTNYFGEFINLTGIPRGISIRWNEDGDEEWIEYPFHEAVYTYNDQHSYEEVIELLDRAIELAPEDDE